MISLFMLLKYIYINIIIYIFFVNRIFSLIIMKGDINYNTLELQSRRDDKMWWGG